MVSGVPWGDIRTTLRNVSAPALAFLVVLWAAGLAAHTTALAAALPGLGHRRALQLSLTGSAVANVLPLGGVAGVALNGAMLRSWRFDSTAFARFTILTNVWDVGLKLLLPALTVPLVTAALPTVPAWSGAAWTGAAVMLGIAVVGGFVLGHRRTASVIGSGLDHLLRPASSRWRPARPALRLEPTLVGLHDSCRQVVAARWRGLTAGNAAYGLLLFALLWSCLAATGAQPTWVVVLAAFTVERVLTLVGLTPGGSGLVELGATGCLIELGVPATGAVAGVILYRLLTFGLEIPVGGAWLALWWWRRARSSTEAS